LPVGTPLEYDEYQYVHQVPGGVISNLKHQLGRMRMEDRLADVLAEIVQVKKELGYPIMVTPFSQFVASQAAINVMTGERYKQITDEIIMYTLGFWGKEAAESIEPNIVDMVLDRPRAKELKTWTLPEASIEDLRQKLGGASVSDEDIILHLTAGEAKEIQTMRAAGPVKEYTTTENPLVALIHDFLARADLTYVDLEKEDFRLYLRK